jgi:hypothetical protein
VDGKPVFAFSDQKCIGLTYAGRFPREMQLGGSRLSYWFFGNIKIPCNTVTKVTKFVGHGRQESMSIELNVWKFRSCGFDFLLVKESDDLMKVEASTTRNRFPKYFEERVIESLHFLLGYPVPWSVMNVKTGRSVRTVVVGCRTVTVPSQSRLPLPTDLIIDNRTGKLTVAHHRRLFDRFLKHTLSYPKRRHPLWGKLNAVYEASAGTFIDAKALTLTVAIESLLENEFSELGKPSKREQRDIRNAIAYMKEWNGPKRAKDRIGGSLSQLLRSRALDKLRELATRGAISEDEWKAWQALRNPSTHLYQSPHDSTESFIHLIEKVEVLFYHLIFYAIGYKGLYMDISLPDWPIRLYPLGKANASESSGSKH